MLIQPQRLIQRTPLVKAPAVADFIIQVTTTGVSEDVTLPFFAAGTYDFVIDWGDSSGTDHITTYNQAETTHTYAAAGAYTVTMTGVIKGWCYQEGGGAPGQNTTDPTQLTKVIQWGPLEIIDFGVDAGYFMGCSNVQSFPTGEAPTWSAQYGGSAFETFGSALTTLDLSAFDLSGCIDFQYFLADNAGLTSFTPPGPGKFVTSACTNVDSMFKNSALESIDVSDWNTVNVTNFSSLFAGDTDLTNLTGADSLDTTSATLYLFMYQNCGNIDPDASGYNYTALAHNSALQSFASGSAMSTVNYDAMLNAIVAGAYRAVCALGTSATYSATGATAHAELITSGWTLTDGGAA